MLRFWLLFAAEALFINLYSQSGNEWIQFNQEYYRIPVGKDGLYRVTYSDLQQVGFPVGSIDPKNLQLFHRGVEQAIHVEGQDDSQFNPTDFIEFIGRKNDGTSDTELYKPASAQPHLYYNLFSDTTVYFLTYSTGIPGKRIPKIWEDNSDNLPAEVFHRDEKLLLFAQEHSNGIAYSTYARNTSFDIGEAWTGKLVTHNNHLDYTVEDLTDFVITAGAPILETLVTGRSDVDTPHRIEIYVGQNTSSLRLLITKDILKFNFEKISLPIEWTDISTEGKLIVRLRVLATGNSARASISFIKVTYPQSFNSAGVIEKIFYLNENPAGKSLVNFQDAPLNTRLFDVTDLANVAWYSPPASTLNPVISNTDITRKLFATNTVHSVSGIKKITFRNITPSQHNYIIISHPLLMKPAAGYDNPVKAYAGYRASDAGGLYDTLVVDVDQLYNQFNYGEISPLAIYRFMRYMVNGGAPKYLFIIGKGLDWFLNYHRNPSSPEFSSYKDLVPTAGFPGSDMQYTIGLGGTTYEPAVPTGRITATHPAQVAAYLNKVIEMEAKPFNDLWRKKVIHLSGGLTEDETVNFRQYLEGYASIAEDVYLGGFVKAQAKNTTNVGELINISKEVNDGVNLITLFGHSSATTGDFEVGFVSNPVHGYNNPGKYPMFLINGCFAGDFFARDIRYGEDWILAANKGATGFIAHSYFGFISSLRFYSDIFYRLAYGDSVFISKGVGDIQQETARRFMEFMIPSERNLTQISQMVLLGDPAVNVFGATKPDYEINPSNVYHQSIDNEPITSFSDSFAINIVVRNFGRARPDSLLVRVTRIFSDASSETYDSLFLPVLNQDTLQFIIRQDRSKSFGSNTFHIKIDPDEYITELNENNNSASYELFVPLNISKNLLPYNFSIVNTPTVDLIFSSSDIAGVARDFDLQIDTVNTFDSPYLNEFIVNGIISKKSFDLTEQDSLVYYWRTRFHSPGENEVAEWTTSSFAHIKNGPEGWAQLHFPQYLTNESIGLVKDPELKLLNFKETQLTLDIHAYGNQHVLPSTNISIKINGDEYNPNDIAMRCRSNTINLIAFDKNSTIPYTAVLFNPLDGRACGKRPQVINSFRSNQLQTGAGNDIFQYMLNVPEGDSVVLFSIGNPGISNWTTEVKQEFEKLGISVVQLSSILQGEPVVIFGKKGSPPGSAVIYRPQDTPVNEQELLVHGTITGGFDSGSMNSPLIGPAQSWQNLITQVKISELPQTDGFSFNITGVSLDGDEELLISGASENTDLTFIDAEQFPYLRLSYYTDDPINLTPSQLIKWMVTYTPVAEGVLLFEKPPTNPIVNEGESVTNSYSFTNISQKTFNDSLTVRYKIFNQSGNTSETKNERIKAPAPNEATSFTLSYNTVEKAGLNDIEVYVNPKILPEQYYENNRLILNSYISVLQDHFNPVIDVTVDGRYLINGDLVSPNPNIVIKIWDENSFIKKENTEGVHIRLKYPNNTFPTEITFDREDISWYPQTDTEYFRVEFSPQILPEGKYELSVVAEDVRGNSSGTDPYKIEFEVSFESKILLLAPYPNPSSTSFHLDFIVSGEIPDQARFEIISSTGLKAQSFEFSDFYIGTNQINWNGKDYQGNDLPNGLYIYQLVFYQNGKQMAVNIPEGERFFKGGFGKLLIKR